MDHLQQRSKWKRRGRKQLGVRRRLKAASEHPRLSVHRTHKHIYAQVIDDLSGRTLAAASDCEGALGDSLKGKTKSERAQIIGKMIAERSKTAGVEVVMFDRGRFLFHGRVKALADAAREGGLKF
jgi:large subunit ribosomal protein L18